MMIDDLIFVRNKVPSLLAVSGNDGTCHGQFYPEIEFDGGIYNRVKSEDLLDAVRVFGVSPDADPGVHVMRQLGTPEEEGVGLGRIPPVSYTHLRAHETRHDLVCRLL